METTKMTNETVEAAIEEYRAAREAGTEPAEAAQAAWLAVRRIARHLRAPRWDEALAKNTSARRAYRSPLGEVLDVARAGYYGGHCARYPRTVASRDAAREVRGAVIELLEDLIGNPEAAAAATSDAIRVGSAD